MNINPLISPIFKLLKERPDGLSEYALIQALQTEGLLEAPSPPTSDLALFQTHFVVMNALYQLEAQLAELNLTLSISPLNIQLGQRSPSHSALNSAISDAALSDDTASAPLREYYLDWTHYDSANEASVEALLNQFWQRYVASDQHHWALEKLELSLDSDWMSVRKRYQLLVQRHHPDKGGDHQQFVELNSAYQLLKQYFGQ